MNDDHNHDHDHDMTEPIRRPLSRRSLLRGGAALGASALGASALGASALGASWVASTATKAHAAPTRPHPRSTRNLVLDYRPSEPTGWPSTSPPKPDEAEKIGSTIGGHTPALKFAWNKKNYVLELLPLGQKGDSPDPVYENTPTDPTVNFKKTLADKFGAHYSFRYIGGLPGHEFRVHTYAGFVNEPTQPTDPLVYGTELYFVHNEDFGHGHPGGPESLRFIQVVSWLPPKGSDKPVSYVDYSGRANPFYTIGGPTSINGEKVCNFLDAPTLAEPGGGNGGGKGLLEYPFVAEAFLVQDTGAKDTSGKDVVNILSGIKWGWQVRSV